ncbi:DUF4357 domain-containing protein [Spiroplasma endosymbiont of Amphibalanus improvisus]|uniref:DUF4357 domain-containing protein n=1 Tax=Spiroplasma endosymbiont of Amphibalanus improvisus TaxID=3066327 RepID=UPI00313CA44E
MQSNKTTIYSSDQYKGMKSMSMTSSNIDLLLLPQEHLNFLSKEELGRDYANKAGIYILVGTNNLNNEEHVYIGQTTHFEERLKQHSKNETNEDYNIKQNFEFLIFITTNDNSLSSTELFYIEKSLIHLSSRNEKINVQNGNKGQGANISKKEAGVWNKFINDIEKLLEIINIDIFKIKTSNIKKLKNKDTQQDNLAINDEYNDKNKLFLKHKDYYAEAFYVNGKFTVLKGSWTQIKDFPEHIYKKKRTEIFVFKKLLEENILILKENKYILTKDYVFNSPSQGAAIFRRNASNGWTEWKNQDLKTMSDIYRK